MNLKAKIFWLGTLLISVTCEILSVSGPITERYIPATPTAPIPVAPWWALGGGGHLSLSDLGVVAGLGLLSAGTGVALAKAQKYYQEYPWKTADQITFEDFKKEVLDEMKNNTIGTLIDLPYMARRGLDELGLYQNKDGIWFAQGFGPLPDSVRTDKEREYIYVYENPQEIPNQIKNLQKKRYGVYLDEIIHKPTHELSFIIEKHTANDFAERIAAFKSKYQLSEEQLQNLIRDIPLYNPKLAITDKSGFVRRNWDLEPQETTKSDAVRFMSPLELELTPAQALQQAFQAGADWANKKWQQAKNYWDSLPQRASQSPAFNPERRSPEAMQSFERMEGRDPMPKEDYGVWRGFKERLQPRLQNMKERYNRSMDQINQRFDARTAEQAIPDYQ